MDRETDMKARLVMDGGEVSEEAPAVEDRVESLEDRVTRLEATVKKPAKEAPRPVDKLKPSRGKNDIWPNAVAV